MEMGGVQVLASELNEFIQVICTVAKLSQYNAECFSTWEVSKNMYCEDAVQDVIETLRKAGYDPHHFVAPILNRLGYAYFAEVDPHLRIILNHNEVFSFGNTVATVYSKCKDHYDYHIKEMLDKEQSGHPEKLIWLYTYISGEDENEHACAFSVPRYWLAEELKESDRTITEFLSTYTWDDSMILKQKLMN
jgi:hypothetical protein